MHHAVIDGMSGAGLSEIDDVTPSHPPAAEVNKSLVGVGIPGSNADARLDCQHIDVSAPLDSSADAVTQLSPHGDCQQTAAYFDAQPHA
jgi:hypothetical protein